MWRWLRTFLSPRIRPPRDGSRCGLCGRTLSQPDEPLSSNCGGHCWGCMSKIEAEGFGVSVEDYRENHARYWAEAAARVAAEDAKRAP